MKRHKCRAPESSPCGWFLGEEETPRAKNKREARLRSSSHWKAVEGHRTPRRWRVFPRGPPTQSVLDCASPLALCAAIFSPLSFDGHRRYRQLAMGGVMRGKASLRRQNFEVRRHVLKMGRVTRYDPDRLFATGKGRMQGIINSSAHDSPAARLANRRFVVRQG
jgi:hypothetical protein